MGITKFVFLVFFQLKFLKFLIYKSIVAYKASSVKGRGSLILQSIVSFKVADFLCELPLAIVRGFPVSMMELAGTLTSSCRGSISTGVTSGCLIPTFFNPL